MIHEIEQSMFDFEPANFLVHQCNCQNGRFAGLAEEMFWRFPWAAPTFVCKGSFGTCEYKDNPNHFNYQVRPHPTVVSMFAQIYPGKPNPPKDSAERRLEAFSDCLSEFAENLERYKIYSKNIVFPYKIGCGLAGGCWEAYKQRIEQFADRISAATNVVIIAKPL